LLLRAEQTGRPATTLNNRTDLKVRHYIDRRHVEMTKLHRDEMTRERRRLRLRIFVAAKEFVALDRGDDANGAFVARLGALDAAEAAHAYRTSQGDFVRQGQENFDRRTFTNVFGKKEVDATRTDVAGFGACFANRGARSPSDGERQPHLEALRSAAF
jgi:hypothetical protein